MIAQLGGPNSAELSQMLENIVIIDKCRAPSLCVTSESSRAGIARAVVCLSWLLEYVHCRKTGGEPDECVNPTRQTRQSTSTAGAGSTSLSATSRVVPLAAAGVSSARFFLGAGAFLTQAHGGTRRCASPFSMLRQALQNGDSDAPDAFAAAVLAALIDAARGVPRDNGIRYST